MLLQHGSAIIIDTCDCKNAHFIGVLNHDPDPSCQSELQRRNKTTVEYKIWKQRKPEIIYKAFVCTAWLSKKKVVESFLGQTDTTFPRSEPIIVTEEECQLMSLHKDCKGNKMIKDGRSFSFKGAPVGEGSWWQEKLYTITNCVVEEMEITKECKNCSATSINGLLTENPSASSAIHNKITYIWDNNEHDRDNPCILEFSNDGLATLREELDKSSIHRLTDKKNQLEFILGNETKMCDNSTAYEVLNIKNIYITIKKVAEKTIQPPTQPARVASTKEFSYKEFNLEPHFQYIENKLINIINKISQETRELKCQNRLLKRNQITSAAQLDGILAGELMGLPKCHYLKGTGNSVRVWKCKEEKTEFKPRMTNCGVIPVATNNEITINHNGWTTIKLEKINIEPECYWKNNIVNFNSKTYLFNETDWQLVKSSLDVHMGPMLKNSDFEIDNMDQWVSKEHPMVSDLVKHQMEAVLELITQTSNEFEGPLFSNNKGTDTSSKTRKPVLWVKSIKNFFQNLSYVVTTLITLGIPLAIILYCGGGPKLLKFCKGICCCICAGVGKIRKNKKYKINEALEMFPTNAPIRRSQSIKSKTINEEIGINEEQL